jgi:magnesium-transporting ATPase (P-type)
VATPSGLSTHEAAARLAEVGPNVVGHGPRVPPWLLLLRQFTHLLALLLWAAAILALVAGTPVLAIAIAIIVVLNALFAFAQEYRADRSTQRLRALLPVSARVVRDGSATSIPVADLVPGDVVLLEAGDRVGADLDVLTAENLHLDESLVTGESAPVPHAEGEALLGGTFVVQGVASAVVTATGAGTALADINRLSVSATRPKSPLTAQLNRVVRVIAVIAVVTGVALGGVSMLLGLELTQAFIFAIGVAVALVPEGLLPTVTLSLARGAELMAHRKALVRRLDAVETLGAATFICTDKTGTLTQNRMNVVDVVTVAGPVTVTGVGYEPTAHLEGEPAAVALLPVIARAALRCVAGRVVARDGGWVPTGDPMEAAIHSLALRVGVAAEPEGERLSYTAERMLSSSLDAGIVSVLGAPEALLQRCRVVPEGIDDELLRLTGSGRRVLAVASGLWDGHASDGMERDLELLGLLAFEDPPRDGVREALDLCRSAGIRIAMITGDHPRTGAAIAREIGLLGPRGVVLDGPALPTDDGALADAIDHDDGVVVARATPADKLRIARALRSHGHVVAMTGDGVNDAPALREADVGIAMGASGSDVAREAADLVLLDDHFGTIVGAIELGRSTFQNVRRFLTYHLTDNVAELTPFVVWALSGGAVPLAITVLQVLALDIASDMLPALALGAEPPRDDIMRGRRRRTVLDGSVIARAFLVLGPTEAIVSMTAFITVLLLGGWSLREVPPGWLLTTASGTAFAAIALGQAANAFACRSTNLPVWRLDLKTNLLVVYAVAAQLLLLVAFLGIPALARLFGGSWPDPAGWVMALACIPAVLLADAAVKAVARRRRRHASNGV